MMQRFFGSLTLILLSFLSFGQNQTIEWSELEKSPGRLLGVDTRNANDFFALRRSGRGLFSSLRVSSHKNLTTLAKERLVLRVDNSPATYEGSAVVGEHFVVFLSDKKEGQNSFFLQEYDDDLEPIDGAFRLASYELEGKRRRFAGSFSVLQSQNKEYLAVVWTIPGKRDEQTTYGFKVFDKDLSLQTEGEYEIPFESKFCRINQMHVSNTGDFFTVVTEYQPSDRKGIFRSYLDYRAVHIYQITEEGMKDTEIDFDGKRVEAMNINSDNEQNFIVTGTYGDKDQRGVKGLFYLKLDYQNQKVLTQGFDEFEEDFITQDWSDRQKKKLEKKRARGKDVEPILYNYSMRDVFVSGDGSVVGSMEQYYVREVTTTDARTGATRTTYYYYYNDIIAFKVGADGGFEWHKKVRKFQVSTNDGGYYSSYERYIDGDKMIFLFNDNSDNYDEFGSFNGEVNLKSSRLSKKKNTVAIVEMDLNTGEHTRRMFFDRSELGAIAVPKLFNVDYNTGEVLIYAVRRSMEKFGILRFGEK